MTLHVYTARIGLRDDDALDITRKSANAFGIAFAPSWSILTPALAKRRAGTFTDDDWTRYIADYTREMEASYVEHRDEWNMLLMCSRAVLLCYCTDPERCHRAVLARDILPRYGAVYGGEVHRG